MLIGIAALIVIMRVPLAELTAGSTAEAAPVTGPAHHRHLRLAVPHAGRLPGNGGGAAGRDQTKKGERS